MMNRPALEDRDETVGHQEQRGGHEPLERRPVVKPLQVKGDDEGE